MLRLHSLVQFENLLDNQPHLSDDFKTSAMVSARKALSKIDDSASSAECLRAILANTPDVALEVIFHI